MFNLRNELCTMHLVFYNLICRIDHHKLYEETPRPIYIVFFSKQTMHFPDIKSLAFNNKTIIMWNDNLRHYERCTVISFWTTLNSAYQVILLSPQAILSGVHRWKRSLVGQQLQAMLPIISYINKITLTVNLFSQTLTLNFIDGYILR